MSDARSSRSMRLASGTILVRWSAGVSKYYDTLLGHITCQTSKLKFLAVQPLTLNETATAPVCFWHIATFRGDTTIRSLSERSGQSLIRTLNC